MRIFAWMAVLALITLLFGTTAYAEDEQELSSTDVDVEMVPQADDQPEAASRAKRTIMFYVCGSNLEEDSGLASYNIKQVLESDFGNGEDVRFVIMTGGTSKWYLDDDDDEENENGLLVFPDGVDVPDDAVYRYDPEEGESTDEVLNPKSQISGPYNQIWEAKSTGAADNPGKLVLLDGNGFSDSKAADTEEWMSDPATLKEFINYSVHTFPADKYDLILWDHGGGTTGGFALDFRREQSFFGSNTMRFAEIVDALKNNEVVDSDRDGVQDGVFDFVNFDACLMGSTEVTLALADYADYYIASPEETPGYGQVYTGWLAKLGQDPDTSARELGTTIVDDFIDFYDAGYDDGSSDFATMALIDTRALLGSGFVEALNTISQVMSSQARNAQFYDELRSVKGSIKYHNSQFYDLGNLVSQLGMALLELDADSASGNTLDTTNEYTEAAKTVLGVLNNPDIIYARNTADMKREDSSLFINTEGVIENDRLAPSGLQLYFPYNIYQKDVLEYDTEIADAVEFVPQDGRAQFLESYVRALYDLNFVQLSGKAVSAMVNLKDDEGNAVYDVDNMGYDELKAFWELPDLPEMPELSTNDWEMYIVELMEGVGNGDPDQGESETKEWLDGVVRQQATEAISVDNVTAQKVQTVGGEGRKVKIDRTKRRSVDGISMSVTAELPAAVNYIAEHEELDYLLYNGGTEYKVETVRATPGFDTELPEDSTGDFLRDYISSLNTATSTTWDLDAPESKVYALKDANGNLHACNVETEPGKVITTFIRERSGVTDPNQLELLLLGFENGRVSSVYLTDDEGNRRIVRASDLKTELQLMPSLVIDEFSRLRLVPMSASSFTVTPENIGDIELVYTDISNISDMADADGDGNAFDFAYEATDIYGSQVDITEMVNNPVDEFIDIKLADVQSTMYTGEELVPQLTYDGQTLVEGVDYEWTRNDNDDPIVLPGSYGITVIGLGTYTDVMITTFEVNATEEDILAAFEAEDAIEAALALTTPESIESGDEVALGAVDEALSIYNGLTAAQQTQLRRQTVDALLAASQKAAAAKAAAASAAATRIDLSEATVAVAKAAYTGKPLEPQVTVTLGDKTLEAGTDYTMTYANNEAAGTGVAVVKGTGSYTGAAVKTFKIDKAKNTLTAKAKAKPARVKFAKTKKANVRVSVKKAITVSKAKGKVTYKKAGGNRKIAIAKNGRITVKKGIKKGTYKVKVKVMAAGDANHEKATQVVTFKVKVA